MHRIPAMILAFLLLVVSTLAQENTCARLIQNSISNVLHECADLEAETLCYGNSLVAFAVDGGTTPDFVGDRISLENLVSFQATRADREAGVWGINLINLLDNGQTLPVQMVIFGDVSLTNLGENSPFIQMEVSNNTGANVRNAPSSDATLKTTLISGETVYATGRLQDNSWLRVELDHSEVGWLSSQLVTATSDDLITILPIIPSDDTEETLYRPVRHFRLITGTEDTNCSQAPTSGVLLQTEPESDITLNINGYIATLEGTFFVQATDDESLYLYAIEEESPATITQDESIYEISGGERLILNPDIAEVSSYNYTLMEILPLELLPRTIIIPTNWLDALTPATPNPLAEITSTSTCTIAAVEAINVRTGPGRDFPLRGSMLPDQSANPQGRAVGTDGGIWWRITPGAWLRFDVVFLAGNCDAVPYIDSLPRQPRDD